MSAIYNRALCECGVQTSSDLSIIDHAGRPAATHRRVLFIVCSLWVDAAIDQFQTVISRSVVVGRRRRCVHRQRLHSYAQ